MASRIQNGDRLQSSDKRYRNSCVVAWLVSSILFFSGCSTTFRDEVEPYFNQFTGMPASAVISNLGEPETVESIENGYRYSWSDQYEVTTREPVQSYIDGQWVTRYYRVERHRLKCTFYVTVVKEIVVAGELEGSARACERLMRSRR